MNSITNATGAPVSGSFKVDPTKGEHKGAVSAQWFSRPDDQKFLSLDDLYAFTKARKDESFAEVINAADLVLDAIPVLEGVRQAALQVIHADARPCRCAQDGLHRHVPPCRGPTGASPRIRPAALRRYIPKHRIP